MANCFGLVPWNNISSASFNFWCLENKHVCHGLQREDLGSPAVICQATVSPYSWEQHNHPRPSKSSSVLQRFDSISHCCAQIRVWRQTCWSTGCRSVQWWQHPHSTDPFPCVPCGVLSDRLWADWPGLIPDSMDSVPIYKGKMFLVSTRPKWIWQFSLQISSDKH